MAVLKEEEFAAFLERRLGNTSSLLIHGDDEALVSSLARQAILKLSDGGGASLLVDQMDAAICKKSPGVFLDAINSMSLLGDRRLVVFDTVDDSCLEFLRESLSLAPGGNFVLLKASSLKRGSVLRDAFEGASHAVAMALYPDDERVAAARARTFLDSQGMKWDQDAEQAFFNLVGYDRPVVTQEITKLVLYCLGSKHIRQEDVEAICGDLAEESLDDTIDAVLSGDLANFDRAVSGNTGLDVKALLTTLASHLVRLGSLMVALEGGQGLDHVVKTARPPIFFKRREAIANQLTRLKFDDVLRLQAMVQALVLKSRQSGDIYEAVTGRGILAMTRNLKAHSN